MKHNFQTRGLWDAKNSPKILGNRQRVFSSLNPFQGFLVLVSDAKKSALLNRISSIDKYKNVTKRLKTPLHAIPLFVHIPNTHALQIF